ncbi:hypothetical protein ABK040_011662 [Willaertia magna]
MMKSATIIKSCLLFLFIFCYLNIIHYVKTDKYIYDDDFNFLSDNNQNFFELQTTTSSIITADNENHRQISGYFKAPPLEASLIKVLGNNCTVETLERDCGGLETLVCINNTCSLCNEDTQCVDQINGVYSCQFIGHYINQTDGNYTGGICAHKNLFDYFSYFDIIVVVTNFLAGVVSSAGGTGGGGVFVPLLHVAGQFSAAESVPLSKVMIFGAAITNVGTLMFKRHPFADRPLIDYDIALMMEPATLLGTIIGVFLNIILPEWVIVALVILVMGFTTILTAKKGISRAIQEFGKKKKEEENTSINKNENDSNGYGAIEDNKKEGEEKDPLIVNSQEENNLDEESQQQLAKIYAKERRTPFLKIGLLILCWIIIFVLNLLKGGHGAPSIIPGLKACSPVYWVLVALSFPIVGILMIAIAAYLIIEYRKKVRLGYKFVEGDVKWNWINVSLYPGACLIAGILAALLGVGGGMIKSPLLLLLGVDPSVGAATAAFMIFFTSSISTVQFAIVGRLPWDYGLLFGLTGFIAGILGYFFVTYLIERWGKKSILIFCVTLITGSATLLMGGVGIYDIVKDIRTGVYMGFNNPCPST